MELARGAGDAAGVAAALEARFPKVPRSASAAQPLKDLFFTAVPGREWRARPPLLGPQDLVLDA